MILVPQDSPTHKNSLVLDGQVAEAAEALKVVSLGSDMEIKVLQMLMMQTFRGQVVWLPLILFFRPIQIL